MRHSEQIVAIFLIAASVLLLLSLAGEGAEGKTITVDDDGGADYVKIQDAIDAADEGDTIQVREGTYEETVLVNKTVDLIGAGNESTLIKGPWNETVVVIEADYVNLSGFSIRGGEDNYCKSIEVFSSYSVISNMNCNGSQRGIRVTGNVHVKPTGNVIVNNSCSNNFYAGIEIYNARDSVVRGNTCINTTITGLIISFSTGDIVTANFCFGSGENGIWVVVAAESTISHNVAVNNKLAGISVTRTSHSILIVSNNCSDNLGKGIEVTRGLGGGNPESLTITDNHCRGNEGDGIHIAYSGSNTVRGNNCSENGRRGIQISKIDNVVANNSCWYNQEAGIYFSASESILENNTCSRNLMGVEIGPAEDSVIRNNLISYSSSEGIWMERGKRLSFLNNTLLSCEYGIVFSSCVEMTLFGNEMVDCGLFFADPKYDFQLMHWNSHDVDASNTVNGKSIYYHVNENGIIVPKDTGQLFLVNCSEVVLEDLDCSGFPQGIFLGFSSDITLEKSRCINSREDGIYVYYCSKITLVHNTIRGIFLFHIVGATLQNNVFNARGIRIAGTDLKHWNSHDIDTSNTVDERSLYYFANVVGVNFSGDVGQIILANASSVELSGLNCSKGLTGISLAYSSWVNITDSVFSNNIFYGLYAYRSQHVGVRKSTFLSNGFDGIHLEDSDEIFLSENDCSWNDLNGIVVHLSSMCTIQNSTCSRNTLDGIYLSTSKGNVLENNSCPTNNNGIYVLYSSENQIGNNSCSNNKLNGIYLSRSRENRIENNTCSSNDMAGLFIHYESHDCVVVDNTFSENLEGIHVALRVRSNVVYHNNIFTNIDYGLNATGNTGYLVEGIGNYWGAVNGPYRLSGNPEGKGDNVSGNLDFKPWLENKVEWPPFAHLDSISPGPAVDGEPVSFKGHGTGWGRIVRYVWRSSLDGEFYNGTETRFQYELLSNGTHSIFFRVQNHTGTWSEEVMAELVVNGRPRAIIESIVPSPATDQSFVNFCASAWDDGEVVRFIWCSDRDGQLYSGKESSFETTGLSVGKHKITFFVWDDNGTRSFEAVKNLTVQVYQPPNQRPSATIFSIGSSPVRENEAVTLSGKGEDEDGEVLVFAWHSDLDGELYTGAENQFTISNLSPGTHTITLKVQDNHGAWSEPVSTTLEVEAYIPSNILPTVTIASPEDGDTLKGTVTIKGSATDQDGTVEKVDVLVDGEWFTATGITSWEFEFDTTTLDNGDYQIKVLAYDGTDYSNDTVLTVTVDNKKKDDDGDSPGFGMAVLLPALLLGLALHYSSKKA